jgi:hypothetical protein
MTQFRPLSRASMPAVDLNGNVFVTSEDGNIYAIPQRNSGVFTKAEANLFLYSAAQVYIQLYDGDANEVRYHGSAQLCPPTETHLSGYATRRVREALDRSFQPQGPAESSNRVHSRECSEMIGRIPYAILRTFVKTSGNLRHPGQQLVHWLSPPLRPPHRCQLPVPVDEP